MKDIVTPWEGIPEDILDYEGFVYEITNLISGRKYIGSKVVYTLTKRGTVRKESNWRYYKSSSKSLTKDIDKLGIHNFRFKVIELIKCRGEVSLRESAIQKELGVLTTVDEGGNQVYYNRTINGEAFVDKSVNLEAYEDKCDNISQALKKKYKSGNYTHPLKGKVHPNKGKKMPQTGHKKNIGNFWYTNGDVNIRSKDADVPEGFIRGYTYPEERRRPKKVSIKEEKIGQKERWQRKYANNPKKCPKCGGVIPYDKRHNTYCSDECVEKVTSDRFSGVRNPMHKHTYVTPKGEFSSLLELGKAFNMTPQGVIWRCKSDNKKYKDYYIK